MSRVAKPSIEKTCGRCGVRMVVPYYRRSKVYCSRVCSLVGNSNWLKRDPNHPNLIRSYSELRKRSAGEKNNFYGKRGPLAPNWRGGIRRTTAGYLEVGVYGARAQRQHRLIAEKLLKRPLLKTEVVHHRDGNRANNNPKNLVVMSRGIHSALHKMFDPKSKRINGRWAA